MNQKRGVSLIVLVITIIVVIILAAAVILNITGNNPINNAKITNVCTDYDNIKTDIALFVNNAKVETKSYFTTQEILSGTGSIREGVFSSSENDKLEKNSDGKTWNAAGYKLIVDGSGIDIRINNEVKTVYKIDSNKYGQLINKLPSEPTSSAKWYIDLNGNVYLVYSTIADIPKWLRAGAKDNKITDDLTLGMFLSITNDGIILPEDPDDEENSSSGSTSGGTTTGGTTTSSSASTVASNASEYYGAVVTNYAANGVTEWKIFHSDGENIYLISSDYIPISTLPKTRGGYTISNTNSTYPKAAPLTYAVNDSSYASGTGSILSSNPARNLLSFLGTQTSSNNNMRAVAYLMDTNVWSVFANSTYADYAIGGPTADMLISSYNKKYSANYKLKVSNDVGYQLSLDGGVTYSNSNSLTVVFDKSDSLYALSTSNGANEAWLASPAVYSTNSVMRVSVQSWSSYSGYDLNGVGFRPVVCLKSSVNITQNANGSVTLN